MKLIAIVGTNADFSYNRKLVQFMAKHFADKAEIEVAEIKDFRLFDEPEDRVTPENILALAKKIEDADGVIVSCPEYDHSIPSALKSLFEWMSYAIHPFIDKPVMVVGASYGTLGSSRAQAHMRQILDAPEIKARVMPSNHFLLGRAAQAFDEEGDLIDETLVSELEGCFSEFRRFVKLAQLVDSGAINLDD